MGYSCDTLIQAVHSGDMSVLSNAAKVDYGLDCFAKANVVEIFKCYQCAIKRYNYTRKDLYEMKDDKMKNEKIFIRLQNDTEVEDSTRALAVKVLKAGGIYTIWTYKESGQKEKRGLKNKILRQ